MGSDRRRITARVLPLRSPEASVPPSAATASERLAQLQELSEYQWRLTGRPRPTYSRATMPTAVHRLRTPGR